MSGRTKEVLGEALALPATERALLVQELLSSLDRPDPQLDALWAREAEARIAAYEAGKMRAIPAEEVFEELDQA